MIDSEPFSFFPKPGMRVVFVGPTRCGKSTLARLYLEYEWRVIIIDLKHEWEPNEDTDLIIHNVNQINEDNLKQYQHLVFRPSFDHLLPENASKLDAVFKAALENPPCLVYIDDLVFLSVIGTNNFARKYPKYFIAVTTGGSQGVVIWSSVQRPASIPRVSLTESDRRITFFLRHQDDRDTVEGLMGSPYADGMDPDDDEKQRWKQLWHYLKTHKHSFYISDDLEEHGPVTLNIT